MMVPDNNEMGIQPSYARLRWGGISKGSPDIFGLGQVKKPLTEHELTKAIRAFFEDKALVLILAGALAAYGGSALEDSPFGPSLVVTGGVFIGLGLLPYILGIF